MGEKIYLENKPNAPRNASDEEEKTTDHPFGMGIKRMVGLRMDMVEKLVSEKWLQIGSFVQSKNGCTRYAYHYPHYLCYSCCFL